MIHIRSTSLRATPNDDAGSAPEADAEPEAPAEPGEEAPAAPLWRGMFFD